jgi:hypothetical protein
VIEGGIMLNLDFQPNFLSEQECKEIATRQMLSFITLPDTEEEVEPPPLRHASGKPMFSLDALDDEAIGEGPELFNWKSRDIYDVNGLLLFREQALNLASGNEWHVCIAASDLLQAQVWCACDYDGSAPNVETLIARALAELRDNTDLEPLIVEGEEDIRLVSYSYPNLGIPCYSLTNPATKFVIKLEDLTIIPLEPYMPQENPESLTAVWSPYNMAVRSPMAQLSERWQQSMNLLPALPNTLEDLPDAIRAARDSIVEQHIITPPLTLIPQKTSVSCAAATAQMLLKHHDIKKVPPQLTIAADMQTGSTGPTPENQIIVVNSLLTGTGLQAVLEQEPSFEKAQIELRAGRPFKTGGPLHARAVGGFRSEVGDVNWLYIYDPQPENQGKICCERWNAELHNNFMYVKPL